MVLVFKAKESPYRQVNYPGTEPDLIPTASMSEFGNLCARIVHGAAPERELRFCRLTSSNNHPEARDVLISPAT